MIVDKHNLGHQTASKVCQTSQDRGQFGTDSGTTAEPKVAKWFPSSAIAFSLVVQAPRRSRTSKASRYITVNFIVDIPMGFRRAKFRD
jgi:hypothetical protein